MLQRLVGWNRDVHVRHVRQRSRSGQQTHKIRIVFFLRLVVILRHSSRVVQIVATFHYLHEQPAEDRKLKINAERELDSIRCATHWLSESCTRGMFALQKERRAFLVILRRPMFLGVSAAGTVVNLKITTELDIRQQRDYFNSKEFRAKFRCRMVARILFVFDSNSSQIADWKSPLHNCATESMRADFVDDKTKIFTAGFRRRITGVIDNNPQHVSKSRYNVIMRAYSKLRLFFFYNLPRFIVFLPRIGYQRYRLLLVIPLHPQKPIALSELRL